MKVKALKSFIGKVSMNVDEVKEIADEQLAKNLVKAKFVEEVKEGKKSGKKGKGEPTEPEPTEPTEPQDDLNQEQEPTEENPQEGLNQEENPQEENPTEKEPEE